MLSDQPDVLECPRVPYACCIYLYRWYKLLLLLPDARACCYSRVSAYISTLASYTASRGGYDQKGKSAVQWRKMTHKTHNIISLMAPHEFNFILKTTTDEFNVIPRTGSHIILYATIILRPDAFYITIFQFSFAVSMNTTQCSLND